jgi:hypothetical protein
LPWWIPLAPAIEALRGALTPPLETNKATRAMGKLSSAPWALEACGLFDPESVPQSLVKQKPWSYRQT